MYAWDSSRIGYPMRSMRRERYMETTLLLFVPIKQSSNYKKGISCAQPTFDCE